MPQRTPDNDSNFETRNTTMGNSIQERLCEMHLQLMQNLEKKIDTLVTEQVIPMREEIASLKVKSSLWGFMAGAIPVILFILIANEWPAFAGILLGKP
jgi:hypothetical protein